MSREQVADLRPGDVVELTFTDGYSVRRTYTGSLRAAGGSLFLANLHVREPDGAPSRPNDDSLTVVSRAPRPLYVNHPRTAPVPGDVVRTSVPARDDDSTTWTYAPRNCVDDGGAPWVAVTSRGELVTMRLQLHPESLRLLVNGETGQAVTS